MDDLAGIPLGTLGIGSGWALIALFVVAILRGQLVPRRTYDDKVHEANEWRAECRVKDQHIQELDDQLRMSAAGWGAFHQLMSELQDRLRPGRGRFNDSGGSRNEQEESL